MRIFLVMQWLLVFAGTMLLAFACLQAAESWHWYPTLLGVVLVWPITWLSVVSHELGHLLGARRAGMFVVRIQLGPLELLAQRRGWKARWRRAVLKAAGFVLAYPHPDRPARDQMIAFVIGGPAMNLFMGVLFAVVAWLTWPSGIAWLFGGAATHSLCVGVVNLLPVDRPIASDGLQLLRYAKGLDDDDPGMLLPRLYGLSLAGVTADALPTELVDRLADGPSPLPLMHVWITLWGCINRGEWERASALESRLESAMIALPPELASSVVDTYSVARTEMACARALAGGEPHVPLDSHLPASADWYHPSLRQRIVALDAARVDDDAACRAALAKAESLIEKSFDKAARIAETRQCEAILALLLERAAPNSSRKPESVVVVTL